MGLPLYVAFLWFWLPAVMGCFRGRAVSPAVKMTQKCDLICFSHVRALSHRLRCCFLSFSLSVFPQRLQESSSPLNTESVSSCPTKFSHRLFMNYCARTLQPAMEQIEVCVLLHCRLMTLAVGYFPWLSCRTFSLFLSLTLVRVFNTCPVSHVLHIHSHSQPFS